MSWKRKQSGSSDMGSPLLLSPCRYSFGVTHSGKMHTSETRNAVELSLLMCGWVFLCGLNHFIFLRSGLNLSLLKPSDFLLFSVPRQESTDYLDRGTTTNFSRKGPSTIAKIKEALNFMRNQQFEVHRAHISPHSSFSASSLMHHWLCFCPYGYFFLLHLAIILAVELCIWHKFL